MQLKYVIYWLNFSSLSHNIEETFDSVRILFLLFARL